MTITSNAVARRDATTAIAIRPGQDMFDDRQVAALAVLGVKDATKADLAVYFHVCRQTGLDPFLKQIYLIARQEKVRDQWVTKQTIQVGIDGFRVIRDRAAKRDGVEVGYSRTIWYDHDDGEHKIWLRPDPPAGCEMTVTKDGKPYPAVLTFAEYVQTNREGKPTGKWRDAPAHQIEKCCEAFALRRAFPHDLGGVRLEDEMPSAEDTPPVQQRTTAAEIISQRQRPAPDSPGPAPAGHPAGHEPAAGPGPATAASADGTGSTPGPAQPARPTGAATGQLGKLLRRVLGSDPDDLSEFMSWRLGRTVAGLHELSKDEVASVRQYLEETLKAAQGDTESAAHAIWKEYRAAHPQPGDGDEAEADADPGEGGE